MQNVNSTSISFYFVLLGSTSAIGQELAKAYAKTGVKLYLHGRNQSILNQLASQCHLQGAQVEIACFDVLDTNAMQNWLASLPKIDLVIFNAGVNGHAEKTKVIENWQVTQAVTNINLTAAMAAVQAVLPNMLQNKQGQIVLISSLAAYFGLPITPAYSASKAGLKAYGEALRGALAPKGIKVNVVMPGYIKSAMCDAMPGPKPFLLVPKQAARIIKKGLAKNKARISFPFPLNFGSWWLAVLPASISLRILRWLGYGA